MRRLISSRRSSVFLLLAGSILAAPASVGAGELRPGVWTTFQHDHQRTGRVDGKGAVTKPKSAWTVPIGGALRSDAYVTELLMAPLEAGERVDIITVAAGRVRATRSDGTEIWKTPIGGWKNLLGVWNVDGKGSPEVFVDLNSSVAVLDGSTGALLRSLPSGQLLQALFVPVDASGAGVVAFQSSRGVFRAYDFRGGVVDGPLLWTSSSPFQTAMLLGDVDGDGKPEIVRSLELGFELVDPLTGKALQTLSPIGPQAYYFSYFLANVDGKPGDEIIAVDDSYVYSPSTGVYVLGVQDAKLKVIWSQTDTATVVRDKDNMIVAGAAVDLDGDAKMELVFSRWDGSAWSTRVVDAANGTVLHTIDGQTVEALADIDGDGKTEIVVRPLSTATRFPTYSTIRVYDYDSRTVGPVAKSWSLPRARLQSVNSYLQRGRAVWAPIPVVADLDASPGFEFIAEQLDVDPKKPAKLITVRGDGTVATERAWDAGTTGSVMWFGDKLTSTTSAGDLLTFDSLGTLRALKRDLTVAGSQRSGTYAGYTLVLPVSSERSVIANTTSSRELRFYDGAQLEPDGAPVVSWRVREVNSTLSAAASSLPYNPVVYLAGPKAPTFANFETVESSPVIVARDSSTGVELWRATLPTGTGLAAPGGYAVDINADGTDDLATVISSTAGPSVNVYDGRNGSVLRTEQLRTLVADADQLFTGALADLDGDGVPELIGSIHNQGIAALKLASEPMKALWSIPKQFNSWNGLVGAAELDGDAEIDLFRVNAGTSFGHYMRLDSKGVVDQHVDPGTPPLADQDRNPAALVRRDAKSFDLVTTGMRDVGEGRIRRLAGDTLATVWTVYATDGKVTELAPADPAALGAPVVADVDGDGKDDVLFGGGDGWLYALSAADGKLLFATDMGVPVDRVIVANVDQDPELEIVATLADGNLVALDGEGKYVAALADAGVDAGGDAGTDAAVPDAGPDVEPVADADGGVPDATVQPMDAVEGGGCGCATAGRTAAQAGFAAFCLAIAAAHVRRRSRQ